MAYFSDIAKRAINAAHGEKMTDWEGRKASDHHDSYSRDRYMPIEDANTRRTYRAKGGEIPEMQSKKGGAMKRKHRDSGGEITNIGQMQPGIDAFGKWFDQPS